MAQKRIIEVEAKIDKAVRSVNNLNDKFEDVNKSVNDVKDSIDKTTKATKDVGKSAKGAEKGVKSLANGFRGVGGAIKAAGIGLVISLLGTLKDIIMQNQAVADLFSQAFEAVSIVFNAVAGAIVDATKAASDATGGFNALGKVLMGLLTIAITPLKVTFYGLKLGIQQVQLAWEKWLGDADPERIKELETGISETKDALRETAEAAVDAGVDIVNNFGEAIDEVGTLGSAVINELSEVGETISNSWDVAGNIVELRKANEIAQEINRGLIEQYDIQAERQRQIRDDERLGITERIAANDRLAEILEEQNTKMLENADLAIQLARYELEKNDSVENQVAYQAALNEKRAIEASIVGQQSEQLANQASLEKERAEIRQTLNDAELEAMDVLEEARAALHVNELDRMDAEAEAERNRFNLRNQDIESRLEQMRSNGQEETQLYADLLAEQMVLKAEHDAFVITSTDERAKKEIEIEQKKQEAIQGLAQMGLNILNEFAEEGSDFAKGLAAVQILFDTYKAVMSTFATASASPLTIAFPAYPYIAASAAGVFGALQLRSLNSESASASNPPTTGAKAASAAVQPSVSVVQASQSNSTLGNIAESNNRPIRAYVTAQDVNSAGAIERNTIDNAIVG